MEEHIASLVIISKLALRIKTLYNLLIYLTNCAHLNTIKILKFCGKRIFLKAVIMFTVKKFIGIIELKWGMLIIAILDMILGLLGYLVSGQLSGDPVWKYIMPICYFAHFIGCILIIISIFLQKHELVICYLITGIIRLVFIIAILIIEIIRGYDDIAMYLVEIIILVIGIYFWICVYSWFDQLGGKLCC